MAEMWKPRDRNIYRQWLEDIFLESEEKLSDWERTFLSSIETRLDNNWNLTQSQAEKLEQIYARLTK